MLDLRRLKRIKLSSRPRAQRSVAHLILTPNYRLYPKVDIVFENPERVPAHNVIFAMNHTDRYNYWPFQYKWWRDHDRFTATWVKGKYYESSLVGAFMEHTNNIPTVSRGYLITKDFVLTLGRRPSDEEYSALRTWINAVASSDLSVAPPTREQIPEILLERARNILGYDFDPQKQSYAEAINELFLEMMRHFVLLNQEALEKNLDLLIFPEGTRSKRVSEGHIGLAQIALKFKVPVVPIGCSGSDKIYPGSSPIAHGGRVVYRFGQPLTYQDMSPFHIDADYEPFSPEAEASHRVEFEGLTRLIMERIDELVDEEYRHVGSDQERNVEGSARFI